MPTPPQARLVFVLEPFFPSRFTEPFVVRGKSQESVRSKSETQKRAKAKASARCLCSSKQTGECRGVASGHRLFGGPWPPCQVLRAVTRARASSGRLSLYQYLAVESLQLFSCCRLRDEVLRGAKHNSKGSWTPWRGSGRPPLTGCRERPGRPRSLPSWAALRLGR